MSDILDYSHNENNQPNLENLYNIYINIKEQTNGILSQYYYDDSIIENPSVDIHLIADKIGIQQIIYVSPECIQDDHSHLTKDNIILLNENDSPEEQNFSIAHEIAHFVTRKNGIIIDDIARGETKLKIYIEFLGLYKTIEVYSKEVANRVSREIGKPVTEKRAFQLFTKIAYNIFLTNEKNLIEEKQNNFILVNEMNKHFFYILKIIYDEEIADYFAANLLVPTEQFLLWKNKTNEEIAKAFKVDERCIKKRRNEIFFELEFLRPKDLASDVVLENQIPLSSDELYHLVAEGLATHDGT